MKTKKTFAGLATVLLLLAAFAPAAMAQSSQDGYIQEGPSVLDRTGGDGGEPPANGGEPPANGDEPAASEAAPSVQEADANDELPFTGLDLGLVAVAGGSLLLLGVGMRRLTRAPDSL